MTDIFIMMGFLTMVLAPCMIAIHRGAHIE